MYLLCSTFSMQVHKDIGHLPEFERCVLTIGTFDGVHLGHRQIISQLKTEATKIKGETAIITFHPHPRKVVDLAKPPIRLLNTIHEKIELLEDLEIDHLVIVPFDERFSQMTANDYIEEFLIKKFNPHSIIIGYDHHFGKGRTGNYLLLEEYSARLGFHLVEISPHIIAENAVSSTRIRQSLLQGEIEDARNLLGYDYFFEGKVITGNQLGRTLGYPTANLQIEDQEKLIPANGIYIVQAELLDDIGVNEKTKSPGKSVQKKREKLKGMMSIGIRPTIADGKFMIEINLFDFDQDIYDRRLRVYVKKFLRPELKFDGLEELKLQLHQDKEESLRYFREL